MSTQISSLLNNSGKILVSLLLAVSSTGIARAQKEGDIIKKGLNFGPLPAIAYDGDKGFEVGAILEIFDYGDGTVYPNYNSKWYFEASYYTEGSALFQIQYDNKTLIPGVRWSSSISASIDKSNDFYGVNGYMNRFDFSTSRFFYRQDRTRILANTDFSGYICPHLKWEIGYHGNWYKISDLSTKVRDKKGYQDPTLFGQYVEMGLFTGEGEAFGGFVSSIRAGLMLDTRDKEGAPSKGVWAEAHITAAPKWLGTTHEHYRYSLTFRNYLPLVKHDILTFAYRINYEGTIGDYAPYYVLPHITVMGENCDKDGMGGYDTIRGLLRSRVMGLDMLSYNAELRWRFVEFKLINQNWALALNAFSDGTWTTRAYKTRTSMGSLQLFDKDRPHITFGGGFRIIMNENFIIAVEYGLPVSWIVKSSNPIYRQDGDGAFYVNLGYLF